MLVVEEKMDKWILTLENLNFYFGKELPAFGPPDEKGARHAIHYTNPEDIPVAFEIRRRDDDLFVVKRGVPQPGYWTERTVVDAAATQEMALKRAYAHAIFFANSSGHKYEDMTGLERDGMIEKFLHEIERDKLPR